MAAVVVFCTTYALILPALTMTNPSFCGIEEHVHTDECYADISQFNTSYYLCSPVHVHTDECYDESGNLICGMADFVVHYHNEYCVDENGSLVCGLPYIPEHVHTDECYQDVVALTCGLAEGEPDAEGNPHEHTEACYSVVERELVCGMAEVTVHHHTAECYDESGSLICGMLQVEAHEHDASCINVFPFPITEDGRVLICGMAEHIHTDECFIDPNSVDEAEQPEAESIDAEQSEAESAEAEQLEAENAEAEQPEAESTDAEQLEAEITDAEQLEAESTDAGQSETESCDAEQSEAESCDAEQSEAESTDAGQSEAESAGCGSDAEEPTVLTAKSENYIVTVSFTSDACIPAEAELRVEEITRESNPELYAQREAEYRETMGDEHAVLEFLLNIGFYIGDEEIEPSAPVNVSICTINDESLTDSLIHFAEEGTELIDTPASEEDGSVSFDVNSFSNFGFFYNFKSSLSNWIDNLAISIGGGTTSNTIYVGQEITLTGAASNRTHTWTSSSSGVKIVSSSGNTAVIRGVTASNSTVTITHKYGSTSEKISITVKDFSSSVTVDDKGSANTATVQGSGSYSHTWKSADTGIATVSPASGSKSVTVTGVSAGTTVLTHTYKTSNKSGSTTYVEFVQVTVKDTGPDLPTYYVQYNETVDITGAEGRYHGWTYAEGDGPALCTPGTESWAGQDDASVVCSPAVNNTKPGTYTLTHTYTDADGQQQSEAFLVKVTAPTVGHYAIYIPKSFTPSDHTYVSFSQPASGSWEIIEGDSNCVTLSTTYGTGITVTAKNEGQITLLYTNTGSQPWAFAYYIIDVGDEPRSSSSSHPHRHIDIETTGGTYSFKDYENGVLVEKTGTVTVVGADNISKLTTAQKNALTASGITLTNPTITFNGIVWPTVYGEASGQKEFCAFFFEQCMPEGKTTLKLCNGMPVSYNCWVMLEVDSKIEFRQISGTHIIDYTGDNECPGKEASSPSSSSYSKGYDFVVSLEEIINNVTNSVINVKKNWEDNNNQFQLRPDSITVVISREDDASIKNKLDFMTVSVTEDNVSCTKIPTGVKISTGDGTWSLKVSELPVGYYPNASSGDYSRFIKYVYSVDEINYSVDTNSIAIDRVYGSEVAYSGDFMAGTLSTSLTNSLSYQQFGVKKIWADSATADHSGDSATVKLSAWCGTQQVDEAWLKNLVSGQTLSVTLNEANDWSYNWGELPIYGKVGNTFALITAFKVDETAIKIGSKSYAPDAADCPYKYTIVRDVDYTTDPENGVYYAKVTNSPNPNLQFTKLMQTPSGIDAVCPGAAFKLTGSSTEWTAVSDAHGIVTFYNLPTGTYTLTELSAPEGLIRDEDEHTVVVNADGSITIDGTAMATFEGILNRIFAPEADLIIYKSDNAANPTGHPLTGVSFKLTKKNSSDIYERYPDETTEYAVGEDGFLIIEDLPVGDYQLTETACPQGYIKLSSPICFSVVSEDEEAKVTCENDEDGSWSFDSDTAVLTVINTQGTELPETGGIGTRPFVIGGLLLMAAAVCGYIVFDEKRRCRDI